MSLSVYKLKPKQILVWRNGKYEPKTLDFAGGYVGRTTLNKERALAMYKQLAASQYDSINYFNIKSGYEHDNC